MTHVSLRRRLTAASVGCGLTVLVAGVYAQTPGRNQGPRPGAGTNGQATAPQQGGAQPGRPQPGTGNTGGSTNSGQRPPTGGSSGQAGGPQNGAPGGQQPIDLGPQENFVRFVVQGAYRYLVSNGIPDHATGTFPNENNPNTIRPQRYLYRVTTAPVEAAEPTPLGHQNFGLAVNGIPFDPNAMEFWNGDQRSGWQYEPLGTGVQLGLDANVAHVQPDGSYHYHGLPTALLTRLRAQSRVVLVGYAADGFPIYGPYGYSDPDNMASPIVKLKSSYRLKTGTRPSGRSGPGGAYDGTFVQDYQYVEGSGDLDECNGRFGITPEYPRGTYYYVLTENWPVVPRQFKGTPDPSFARGQAAQMGQGQPGGQGSPGGQPGQGGAARPGGQTPPTGTGGQTPPSGSGGQTGPGHPGGQTGTGGQSGQPGAGGQTRPGGPSTAGGNRPPSGAAGATGQPR